MPEPVNKDDEKSSRAARPRASQCGHPQSRLHWRWWLRARHYLSCIAKEPGGGVCTRLRPPREWHRNLPDRLFHFDRAVPPAELIQDKDTDAVFVLSRHDSHAQYVIAALSNQKQVFVEKPLAISASNWRKFVSAYQEEEVKNHNPFLVVGFNRRFAPFTQKLKQFFTGRQESMIVNIRVNAGYIPSDHWVQRSEGGRVVGELCHFIDWARCVVGSA